MSYANASVSIATSHRPNTPRFVKRKHAKPPRPPPSTHIHGCPRCAKSRPNANLIHRRLTDRSLNSPHCQPDNATRCITHPTASLFGMNAKHAKSSSHPPSLIILTLLCHPQPTLAPPLVEGCGQKETKCVGGNDKDI